MPRKKPEKPVPKGEAHRKRKLKNKFADEVLANPTKPMSAIVEEMGVENPALARSLASAWYNDPYVQGRMAASLRGSNISASHVIGRLGRIAFASIGDFLDPNTFQLDLARAQRLGVLDNLLTARFSPITGKCTEIKLVDPMKALSLLSKIFALEQLPGPNKAALHDAKANAGAVLGEVMERRKLSRVEAVAWIKAHLPQVAAFLED